MRNPEPNLTDQQLANRIQEGDRVAFKALFCTYYEELCDFVESQIGSSEAAEDLVQNVLLNLWRRRKEWEPTITLRAYLYGAARNESIKYRKHRQVRRRCKKEEEDKPRKKESPGSRPPLKTVEYDELSRAMTEAISELPERRRQVYVLSRHHGLTYKEIADVMDISPKTVDNQMVEALKTLRQHLEALYPNKV